ncbi:RNA-binding KH domain-containing protein RCF3 [Iris pallida]|uniref:RNA-binding KH domain-containing protein RCF3 n=1 Tax=Iris pallida TaxID=29817 RepID=A0AAX6DP50_IRIPA|nr:RNA-binding KH domain-containing protein RCF3 [Iris pallida]
MERSRSKRNYHFDHENSGSLTPPRSRQRFDTSPRRRHHHRRSSSSDRRPLPPPPPPPSADANAASPSGGGGGGAGGGATTFFQILCPDFRVGSIIGKSGSIIKSFRSETGAWINVHPLTPGDEERIIETSDNRRREPDGRPPQYSPAQEALLMIHERIVDDEEFDGRGGGGGDEEEEDGAWGRGRGRGERVTTRLVVPRAHVGCLLGKGGKIIEQMRMETRTHIRILPRDQYTPRCVSTAEEIVQIVGEGNSVKKAVAIISARLKESLHRDRGPFRRLHSSDDYFPPDDEFMHNTHHQSAAEGLDFGSRSSSGQNRIRNNTYNSQPSGFGFDADPMTERSQSFPSEDLVFRILCPDDKVDSVIAVPDGIIELLRADVGVDVRVNDPVPGSHERVIVITSEEGPDDDLFPAQEALLHIQTHIVDLGPDKDNIITTRLLISATEIGCLEGTDGSLSEIKRFTSANVQLLPKEDLPLCASQTDELIQIVGEIREARKALVQVTAKLRSHLYREISNPKDMPPSSVSAPNHSSGISGLEPTSVKSLPHERFPGSDPPPTVGQNMQIAPVTWQPKDNGDSSSASHEQKDNSANDDGRQSGIKRFPAPLVTRSTLEVVIPSYAVPSLLMRSGSKLAQISEMSGAKVSLIEDQPEETEKVVKISGTPEQSERAQSLLQGFILSTQDDIPSA